MRYRALTWLLPVLLPAAASAWPGVPASQAQEEKTESRMQAVLKLNGKFLPDGGFRVSQAPADGPGANMELPNATRRTRGILDEGDVITAVEGKRFRDRREFLDLMNEAHREHGGKVRITVADVKTGRPAVWVVRPVVVRMNVPVANRAFDFSAELGGPVPAAPPVPAVPAAIGP